MAAVPLILFRLGDHYWFFRDDWIFITERKLSVDGLMEPHAGHWSAGLVLFFRAWWKIFGANSYVPWQAAVVLTHVGVMALGRQVMRRAGVGPWTASIIAATGLFFGSGREDILWAFQFGFTGSLMLGLLQLVLADHDGPFGRRDVLALVAGVLGIVTASPFLMVWPVTVVTVLVKRGWRPSLFQAAPLGIMYLAWSAAEDPQRQPFGKAPNDILIKWVRHGIAANFRALAIHDVAAGVLILAIAVGLAIALIRPLTGSRAQGHRFQPPAWDSAGPVLDRIRWVVGIGRSRLAPIAAPVGLLAASILFMYSSGQARWWQGPMGAGAARYLYAYAALTLPAIAVAAQSLAERTRVAGIVVIAILLVAVPSNLRRFDDPPFGPGYFKGNEELLRNSVRMPFARSVSGDVRPIADPFMGEHVTMRFLLESVANGRLKPAEGPMPPMIRNQLTLTMSLAQRAATGGYPSGCDWVEKPSTLRLRKGEQLFLSGPVKVRLVKDGQPSRLQVEFRPESGGSEVTVEHGLEVSVESSNPAKPLRICRIP